MTPGVERATPQNAGLTRVVSGVILAGLMIAAIWLLGVGPLVLIAEAVLLLAFLEYAALAERLNVRVPKMPAGAAAVLTCAAMAFPGGSADVVLMAAVVGLGALVLGSGRGGADALHDFAGSLLPSLYLGLPLGALIATREIAGREATLLLLVTVIVSDTAQYYSGRAFGRRLLAPAVSPKKTVEGALGGVIGGTATMVIVGRWWLPGVHPLWLAGIGFALVVLGIVGDLFESLIKRGAGVKDASSLIPGHGGVLDRIDALLFAAPMYYVFVKYVH
jgi:phosphatidate cytidylyltransferase